MNSKTHLRTRMKILESNILGKDRRTATKKLADLGEDFLSSGGRKIIAGFFPTSNEITPLLLMQALNYQQLPLALPKRNAKNEICYYKWWPGARLETSENGICVPQDESEIVTPDYLIVPVLGFDRMGNRLGKGNGFYAEAIHALRAQKSIIVVGVGFAEQELDDILEDDADGRLDWIITPKELRGFTQ